MFVPALQDPTDIVRQGEQLRYGVEDAADTSQYGNVIGGNSMTGFSSLVLEEDGMPMRNTYCDVGILSVRRRKNGDYYPRVNAGIATTSGTWIVNDWSPLLMQLQNASNRFAISGVTKDSTGAALGNCRVVCEETGRQAVGAGGGVVGPGSPIVGETISDGSGNYTIPVAMNIGHQLMAYKAGGTDVAGITRNDVTPTHIG
jgi:hypothetical protein